MNSNKTLGFLKKRILCSLDEYSLPDGGFVTDGNRETLLSKMPDVIYSCLVRMYESLDIAKGGFKARLYGPELVIYERRLAKELSFFSKSTKLAMYFRYYGSGKITVYNSEKKAVFEKQYDGNGNEGFVREKLSLTAAGIYYVSVDGGISVRDFTLYYDINDMDLRAIPMMAYNSFELPLDFYGFCGDSEALEISVCDGFAFIPKCKCRGDEICIMYKKAPAYIDESTADDFVFDLSPLAFEALCALCASELCREEESALYTRLFYKYSDLCTPLYDGVKIKPCRNSFYVPKHNKGRW